MRAISEDDCIDTSLLDDGWVVGVLFSFGGIRRSIVGRFDYSFLGWTFKFKRKLTFNVDNHCGSCKIFISQNRVTHGKGGGSSLFSCPYRPEAGS